MEEAKTCSSPTFVGHTFNAPTLLTRELFRWHNVELLISNFYPNKCFQMAKYNLETRYSVVGLSEHFHTSISVMEQYLPGNDHPMIPSHVRYSNNMLSIWIAGFFSGATARIENTSKKANRNPHPTPSNQAMYACINMLVNFNFIISDFLFSEIFWGEGYTWTLISMNSQNRGYSCNGTELFIINHQKAERQNSKF